MNRAMIFAAGLGTRLKPLTDTLPKALIPVAGKPLLEHLLLKMKVAGITDVTLNVHHFADQIIRFLDENNHFGLRIRISDEREMLLETGGGIRHAIPLLTEDVAGEAPILIHNVDILSNLDLPTFCQVDPTADATLLVSSRDTFRYLLFNDENRLVGWTNLKTGEVRSPYPNLDVNACRRYAFAGIHLFSPRLFPCMLESWEGKFSIIDFYLSLADKKIIRAFPKEDLRLIDVGKLDSLSQAEAFISE